MFTTSDKLHHMYYNDKSQKICLKRLDTILQTIQHNPWIHIRGLIEETVTISPDNYRC